MEISALLVMLLLKTFQSMQVALGFSTMFLLLGVPVGLIHFTKHYTQSYKTRLQPNNFLSCFCEFLFQKNVSLL